MSSIANIRWLPYFVLFYVLAITSELAAAQTGYSSIAAGEDHACVIQNLLVNDKQSQKVLCWGHNDFGQLGSKTGDANYVNTTPTAVVGLSGTVKQLAAGEGFTCALISDGTVQCWGGDLYGNLGLNYWNIPSAQTWPSYGNTPVPQTIGIPNAGGGYGPVVQISAGGSFACAMTSGSDNTPASVFCWGDNRNYELGTTGFEYSVFPVSINLPWAAGSIATGVDFACASGGIFNNLQDANVYCWGNDAHGELGDGATTLQGNHAAPSIVVGLPRVAIVGVTATAEGACALDDTGTGWCWGDDSAGEVGNGIVYPNLATDTPVQVPASSPFRAMWGGSNSWENCGTSSAGLYCTVGYGQVIARNTYFDPSMWRTQFAATPTAVSSGGAFTCAISAVTNKLRNGTTTTAQHVFCWGNDDYGQIGNGGTYGVGTSIPQLIL